MKNNIVEEKDSCLEATWKTNLPRQYSIYEVYWDELIEKLPKIPRALTDKKNIAMSLHSTALGMLVSNYNVFITKSPDWKEIITLGSIILLLIIVGILWPRKGYSQSKEVAKEIADFRKAFKKVNQKKELVTYNLHNNSSASSDSSDNVRIFTE